MTNFAGRGDISLSLVSPTEILFLENLNHNSGINPFEFNSSHTNPFKQQLRSTEAQGGGWKLTFENPFELNSFERFMKKKGYMITLRVYDFVSFQKAISPFIICASNELNKEQCLAVLKWIATSNKRFHLVVQETLAKVIKPAVTELQSACPEVSVCYVTVETCMELSMLPYYICVGKDDGVVRQTLATSPKKALNFFEV